MAKSFQDEIQGRETSDEIEDVERNKKALKTTFEALMKAGPSDVESAAKELIESAEKEKGEFAGGGGPSNEGAELADLVIRLNGQFPDDIGLFVQFFLNYVKLQPGEAMYLQADDIHAYLSGGGCMIIKYSNVKLMSIRYRGMHGGFGQCRPRRLHAQVQGRRHAGVHVNLPIRPQLRAEDVARRLSVRYAISSSILIGVIVHSLRSSHRRV